MSYYTVLLSLPFDSLFMFVTVNTTLDTIPKITVVIKTPNVTYDVGARLDLDCEVKATSKPIFVQWIKHAGDIVLENKTIPPAIDDFKLREYHLRHKINKVSLHQTGTYICQAEILNSSQPVKAYYTLRVRGIYHYHHHSSSSSSSYYYYYYY